MSHTYYIDGYNLLHRFSDLGELENGALERARDMLIEVVAHFCSDTGERAIIYFDGSARAAGRETHPVPLLTIVYSPRRKSADALIERAVHDAGDPGSIIVVTADRGISDLCRGLGALVITPEDFLTTIEEARERTVRKVGPSRGKSHIASLEDRLDTTGLRRLERMKENLGRPPAGPEEAS